MVRLMHKGNQVSYSEVLRLIGSYIDWNGLSEARILETQEGFILQGRLSHGERVGQIETYQLTAEDIMGLLEEAYARRGKRV